MEQPKNLRSVIYFELYEKSTVDGVRILYEDQWPIDEICQALAEWIRSKKPDVFNGNIWATDKAVDEFEQALLADLEVSDETTRATD